MYISRPTRCTNSYNKSLLIIKCSTCFGLLSPSSGATCWSCTSHLVYAGTIRTRRMVPFYKGSIIQFSLRRDGGPLITWHLFNSVIGYTISKDLYLLAQECLLGSQSFCRHNWVSVLTTLRTEWLRKMSYFTGKSKVLSLLHTLDHLWSRLSHYLVCTGFPSRVKQPGRESDNSFPFSV